MRFYLLFFFISAHTLAAAKHLDDQGKLVVIDGNTEENSVAYEVGKAFDKLFLSKYGKEPVGTLYTQWFTVNMVSNATTLYNLLLALNIFIKLNLQ